MPQLENGVLVSRWYIDDVQSQAERLTDEEALCVLEHLCENHDANLGINWDVIDAAVECLYPEPQGFCEEGV